MNKASPLNSHCLVKEVHLSSRKIKDDADESEISSRTEISAESDSTDSDESETMKADSCRDESIVESDSCNQSEIRSRNSTLKKEEPPSKWSHEKSKRPFFRIFNFFRSRRRRKEVEERNIPEDSYEFGRTKILKSKSKSNNRSEKNQKILKTSEKPEINNLSETTLENGCDKFIKGARSTNLTNFQHSKRSIVSKKVICCSTCSSPMVIHEILLANPQENSNNYKHNLQHESRIREDTVLDEDESETNSSEDEPPPETYVMEKSQNSVTISEDTESFSTELKHSTSAKNLQNTAVSSEIGKGEIQNIVDKVDNLYKPSNDKVIDLPTEIITRKSVQDSNINSLKHVFNLQNCSKESEKLSKFDNTSENSMSNSNSEKVIAEIDYNKELEIDNMRQTGGMPCVDSEMVIAKVDYTAELSSSTTKTFTSTSATSTTNDTESTIRLDKNQQKEIKTITDNSESDGTILEEQFLISDQSFESHNEIDRKEVDRYSSFKKKYIPVRSLCDTASSMKSGSGEVTSNSCSTPVERTEYLFYPRKFCNSIETDRTHTVMWVSHHYPPSPKKIEDKDTEVVNILENSMKRQDNSVRYCAPKDILEMTLGKYESKTLNSKNYQNKVPLDVKQFQSSSDSIQNIYLNKTFHNQPNLEPREELNDEFEFPRDIKINGVVYRQFHRDYIPIKLKSEYKWKLFARKTIYSRSRRSVHSSKYNKVTNKNKEKSRKISEKKCKSIIKSSTPSSLSRVSLTESANDEEDCRTLKEQLSKISICLSDYSDD